MEKPPTNRERAVRMSWLLQEVLMTWIPGYPLERVVNEAIHAKYATQQEYELLSQLIERATRDALRKLLLEQTTIANSGK